MKTLAFKKSFKEIIIMLNMFLNHTHHPRESCTLSSQFTLHHCTPNPREVHCPAFCLLKLQLCPVRLLFSLSPISSLCLVISHFLCLKQLRFIRVSTFKAKMRLYLLFESFPRSLLYMPDSLPQGFLKKD